MEGLFVQFHSVSDGPFLRRGFRDLLERNPCLLDRHLVHHHPELGQVQGQGSGGKIRGGKWVLEQHEPLAHDLLETLGLKAMVPS